jgi:hypothetical protein
VRLRALALCTAVVLAAAAAPRAQAHVVYGTTTLSRLVAESDLVVAGRVEPETAPALAAVARPVVALEVREVLFGAAPAPDADGRVRVAFAQHGHGVAEYAPGDDVVVFLRAIERSRELDELAGSGLRFVSVQEHDEKASSAGDEGAALLAAARAYAALRASVPPGEREAALRRLTLELVGSPWPRLSGSAVRDLVALGDALALPPAEAARLAAIAAKPATPLGVRIALTAELERRQLVDGAASWAALARDTRGPERAAAIHAAGAHPSPAVTEALVAILRGDDPPAAEAAAVALGSPGNDAAVPALTAALRGPDPRRAGLAVRGLAGVATPAARAALAQAAADHPDPLTRRRAAAELAKAAGETAGAGPRPR